MQKKMRFGDGVAGPGHKRGTDLKPKGCEEGAAQRRVARKRNIISPYR